MKKQWRITSWIASLLVVFLVLNVFGDWVSITDLTSKLKKATKPEVAQAVSQFTPTSGTLAVGTNTSPITSGATTGNVGGWQGTLAADRFTWAASSTTSGIDQQLNLDGTALSNSNTLIISMTTASNSATLSRLYQICDWTSSTGVDNAADSNCTTGGWRTLNVRKTGITTAASTAYVWHIYDGYWSTAANTNVALSTPLSNFIRGSDGRIILRSFSATNCTICTHSIDYARVDTVVDPIYSPSGMVTSTASTVTNDYRNAENALWAGQSGSDNNYAQVAGTVSSIADFYMKFTNVRTAPGMNTILVRAEYSCTTTGINIKPKIYNFASSTWEDLTATTIACSATDATSAFSKSNITMSDYISGGEIRVGWYGSGNSTVGLRIDTIYVIVGSVNSDSAQCEISFGTGTATNCTNTRAIDTTAATTTWSQTSEAESTAFGHAYYAQDNDADATSAEHASSANLWIPATVVSTSRVTGLVYAANWSSATTTMTSQMQFKDFSGGNATISGGWTLFGTTNAAATYTYEDSVTNGYFGSNPDDYLDTNAGKVNVRIRTTASTAAASVTRNIDFVFVSMQWTETSPVRYTLNSRFLSIGGTLAVGTNTSPITSGATTGNVGGWQGTLAADSFTWTASSTASGLDQELYTDNALQNNANKMIVTMSAASNSVTLNRLYQICDWSSTTDVDNAADSNCTGGGWRTMNIRKTAITTAANTSYVWHLYNGYWSTSANTNVPLSTPISNFLRVSDGRVLVRAFSSTNCTICTHSIDYLRVDLFIDPIYLPAGLTTSTASTVTGDYRNAENGLLSGQSGSDNNYAQVAGTAGSISDFYFTFNDIRTYSNMNTILVRAEYSCTTTGINIKPKIYNFASSTWEDLTATTIACSATDATSAFSKSNVTVTNYLSNGQARIGWYGSGNSTVGLRIDQIYVIFGSVNTDNTQCEISFGTGTATNCTNTRAIDTTAATTTWSQTSEAESTAFGHAYYAQDNDADATSAEHASSANLWIPASVPANAQGVGRIFATNISSATGTMTSVAQFKDMTGANATVSGGWTTFGANALAAYVYQDSMTNGYFNANPEDYADIYNGRVNMRFRTSVSTAAAAVTRSIDFAFTSLQWVEPPGVNGSITLTMNANSVAIGNVTPGTPVLATSTATVLATNLANGYQLMINSASATSTLLHTNGVDFIPDATDWNGAGNATSTPGSTFSFRVSTSTGNYNSTWWGSATPLFAGISTTTFAVMVCSTCANGNTTTSISYRLNPPTTQLTGTYNGTTTYTAIASP